MQVWTFVALISFVLASTNEAVKIAYEEADPKLFKLSADNFKSSVATGNWFVFYGAKWCGHCQKLTPEWLKLQEYVKEKKYSVNVAKIECTIDAQLCEKIDGYPYIEKIENGESKGEMDRELNSLISIAKSYEASISRFNKLQEYIDEQIKPDSSINPKGELVFLTDDLFTSMTNKKPWLLVFFAPWEPDTRVRFRGSRQGQALENFALTFVNEPSFSPVKPNEIGDKIKKNEVALFYVYDDEEDLEAVIRASKQVKTKIPFYICPDKKGFKDLKVKGNSLVIVKDGGISQQGDLNDKNKVVEWIMSNRFAMAPVLDADSQEHLIMNAEYLVITVVDPDTAQGKETILHLKKAATAWHEENPTKTKVRFTYIDGIKFSHYTKQVYGISAEELPRFVVTKPHDDLYWDTHESGALYTVSKASYFEALEEVQNNTTDVSRV
ncbi:hypothetical protein HDV01_003031 [Terramyces sp. JEL0728]|nr:hypothetical protein HDV01_003031 [Terramyces sp. JEL0728]